MKDLQLLHLRRRVKIFISRLIFSPMMRILDYFASLSTDPKDAIVVFGFWRSGTTYLYKVVQKLTDAKIVGEPFEYNHWFTRKYHNKKLLPTPWNPFHTEMYPYARDIDGNERIHSFYKRILRGRLGDYLTCGRSPLRNFHKNPVLVKFVRGNLCIGAFTSSIGNKAIFIIRHPGAVVASISRGENMNYYLSNSSFADIFLSQDSLMRDYLGPFEKLLRSGELHAEEYIAMYWCIANMVPLQQMSDGVFSPLFIIYEELVLNRDETIKKINEYLGTQFIFTADSEFNFNSSSTRSDRLKASAEERVLGWKNSLDFEQIERIYKICERFDEPVITMLRRIDSVIEDGMKRMSGTEVS